MKRIVWIILLFAGISGCGVEWFPDQTTTSSVSITTTSLPSGTVGTAYSQSLSATGGTAPYTWSHTGTLPAGVDLSTAGVLSGTPTESGTFPITVQVSDSSSPALTATKSLSLVINTTAFTPVSSSGT